MEYKKLMRSIFATLPVIITILWILTGCQNTGKSDQETSLEEEALEIPEFNEDSAYQYIADQLDFGPRVPNSEASRNCARWLSTLLDRFTDKIYLQKGKADRFDGEVLDFVNIIGSFNPEYKKRIMLCAHWDTRAYADQDNDPAKIRDPIPGANDGASGVGVLLEVARILEKHPVSFGVDIILFDVEDQGTPEYLQQNPKPDTYCLGSQYWARKPHVSRYHAKYGILLDMVGARNSTFRMEGNSMHFAPTVTRKVWDVANKAGYGRYFLFERAQPIIDDHFYINNIIGIPTLSIIFLDPAQPTGFGDFWHTHDDDLNVIDKEVLNAVGQTLLEVIYREDKGIF